MRSTFLDIGIGDFAFGAWRRRRRDPQPARFSRPLARAPGSGSGAATPARLERDARWVDRGSGRHDQEMASALYRLSARPRVKNAPFWRSDLPKRAPRRARQGVRGHPPPPSPPPPPPPLPPCGAPRSTHPGIPLEVVPESPPPEPEPELAPGAGEAGLWSRRRRRRAPNARITDANVRHVETHRASIDVR